MLEYNASLLNFKISSKEIKFSKYISNNEKHLLH